MVARNSVFGPGIWNLDLAVHKNTKLSERFTLQLRLELYNVFNHANFWVYTTDVDVSSYSFVDGYRNAGLAQSANGRNTQIAAKLIF
jgi:hypothetical protein